MERARRRFGLILEAYGSDASWNDFLRIAIIRLHDLAKMLREKANELQKSQLRGEAEEYDCDARFLADFRDGNGRQRQPPVRISLACVIVSRHGD